MRKRINEWLTWAFGPKSNTTETVPVASDGEAEKPWPAGAKKAAKLGEKHGYHVEQIQLKNKLLILVKKHEVFGPVQMNVYYTTMTIGTSFKHPSKGKTQLFRRNCSWANVEAVLKNPRAHIGTGYYKR